MRIIVCVKQVYDPKTVKVSRSREELDLREAVKLLNPPDKYALEAALRLRDAVGGEVIALTVGGADAEDVVHEAVAMGADHGILVTGSSKPGADGTTSSFQPLASNIITGFLAAALEKLAPVDLVLTGQSGLTNGSGSLAPRLAAALGWPIVLDVVRFDVVAADLTAVVVSDGHFFSVSLSTPGVVAVVPGPERPRYPHPSRIANAWEPGLVECWTAAGPATGSGQSLGIAELAADTETGGLVLGPERVRGQVIKGAVQDAAAELAGILKTRRLI